MVADRGGYTLKDIAARVGLSPRTVIDWAEKEVVRPDRAEGRGSGNPRVYSERNLLEFAVAKELVSIGFPVRRVKHLLDLFKHKTPWMWKHVGGIVLELAPSGEFYLVQYTEQGDNIWQ